MSNARQFMALGSKSQCLIAEKMAKDIKDFIFDYSDQIPLALAIGVLRIVEKEILEANNEG